MKHDCQSCPDKLKYHFHINDRFFLFHLLCRSCRSVCGWEFTATSLRVICSTHYTLWTIKSPKPQVFRTHVVKQMRVSLESLVMCFREHLSSEGAWCWTEILLCMWLRQKAEFLPACVSAEPTKPCFISTLGKIFALISSKTGSLLRLANQSRTLRSPASETERWSQILSITGFKSTYSDVIQTFTHSHSLSHTH